MLMIKTIEVMGSLGFILVSGVVVIAISVWYFKINRLFKMIALIRKCLLGETK